MTENSEGRMGAQREDLRFWVCSMVLAGLCRFFLNIRILEKLNTKFLKSFWSYLSRALVFMPYEGAILLPKGYLAMSGEIFSCHI